LGNRFLKAAPRAFEKLAGAISPVFKTSRFVSDAQFSFEKLAAHCLQLLTADKG
jgi:hypothetical protein